MQVQKTQRYVRTVISGGFLGLGEGSRPRGAQGKFGVGGGLCPCHVVGAQVSHLKSGTFVACKLCLHKL